jgi:hypothetical protein
MVALAASILTGSSVPALIVIFIAIIGLLLLVAECLEERRGHGGQGTTTPGLGGAIGKMWPPVLTPRRSESRSHDLKWRLFQWAIFAVVFSFVPFCFMYLIRKSADPTTTWTAVLEPKDLILITLALGTGGFGELFLSYVRRWRRSHRTVRLLQALALIGVPLAYSYQSAQRIEAQGLHAPSVVLSSWAGLIGAVFMGGFAILASDMLGADDT